MKVKLDSPEYYINRELSWCEFNHRVLEEAMDATNPLLERFRFAAIVSSNLDEFFMVRVASLKNRIAAGDYSQCPAGLTPQETLSALSIRIHRLVEQVYQTIGQLLAGISEEGVALRTFDSLAPAHQAFLTKRFESEFLPVLTPMAVDPAHPFPNLINLGLNVGVLLAPASDGEDRRLAIVPLPTGLPRLISLPDQSRHFVLLEDVIRRFLPRLFKGQEILENVIFRVTRDSELDWEEEVSTDLLKAIEAEVRKRRTNAVVRFEVEQSISEFLLQMFRDYLEVGKEELYLNPCFLDPRFLSSIADLAGLDSFRYRPLPPQMPVELRNQDHLWTLLREQDLVLHHPYESFEPVVQLISQAADDPDVLAIKQTLYRTSPNSQIIRALARAALNGKQVAVLVELTARFDEERNIGWAIQLEKAGVHVIYGLVGLKAHAKILLIVRREHDGIRRYVHLGTGNYNERTARLYTDITLLTGDEAIGSDASGFFNTITGYSDPPEFQKLTMAPLGLREKFVQLIRREAERAQSGQHAAILAKMNSLVDTQIIQALYEASQAGVNIKLAVRGICCLRPGVKGVSERITVVSIVDQFLEHSRLFYFFNGGDEEIYCSSADWMPRNLDRRVELLFPVTSDKAKEHLRRALDLFFLDNCKARLLQSDGSYSYKKRKKNEEVIRFQEAIHNSIAKEHDLHRTLIFKPQTIPPNA